MQVCKYAIHRTLEPTYGGLRCICRADSTAGSANLARSKLDLLESVDGDVKIQVDGDTIRDEDTVVDVLQALLLQDRQLGEESGDMEDHTRSDEVDLAVLGDQTAGKEMEAVPDQHLWRRDAWTVAPIMETHSYETPWALSVTVYVSKPNSMDKLPWPWTHTIEWPALCPFDTYRQHPVLHRHGFGGRKMMFTSCESFSRHFLNHALRTRREWK